MAYASSGGAPSGELSRSAKYAAVAGGVGGIPVGVVIQLILGAFGVNLPPELATGIGSVISGVLALITGRQVSDS